MASHDRASYEPLSVEVAGHGATVAPPGWCRVALGRVLHDLQEPRPLALEVGWTGDGHLWIRERGEPDLTGLSLAAGDAREWTIVRLAETMQTMFLESRGAWGEPRPRCCPDAEEPPVADLLDGVAFWWCGGAPVVRVGDMTTEP